MSNKKITNNNELREATVILNTAVLTMCNSNSTEEICEKFSDSKELLIEIFKYCIETKNKK